MSASLSPFHPYKSSKVVPQIPTVVYDVARAEAEGGGKKEKKVWRQFLCFTLSVLHCSFCPLNIQKVKKSTPALILNFDSNKSCLLLPSEGPLCPSAQLSKSVTAIKAVHSLWRCCCCCGCWLFCNNLCRPVRMKLNSLVSNPK